MTEPNTRVFGLKRTRQYYTKIKHVGCTQKEQKNRARSPPPSAMDVHKTPA